MYRILQDLLVTSRNLETKERWNQKLREHRKGILTSGSAEGGEERKAEENILVEMYESKFTQAG